MLELKNITKIYHAGGEDIHALKGVSLKFRKNEFVSILGPSGCGKTTMLNIIGGLDQYTDGDLVIDGRSTKEYKDRDWDAYRNHAIGFVFQSYNLIPHQSVLQNVELALTLSGVSKTERRKRAIEALQMVGLGDQLKKRPSEMSGGQCQRVAIARAVVNNPDIILADEPTGALDTETSVQVMEILKEISKERLVIMVTHNPDLANQYSTRIVKMLDGNILSDSMPLAEEEESALRKEDEESVAAFKAAGKKEKKPSMSFATSFGLSLKNLFTKKGRTILTSFAGSIGIIGIALIYAVSNGTTTYIDTVQEETLSSYPLMIESQHMDTSALLSVFMNNAQSKYKHEKDAVYQKQMIYDMLNAMSKNQIKENDLGAFKKFIEKERADSESKLSKALSGVQYGYNYDLIVYTKSLDGDIIRSDTRELMRGILKDYLGTDMSSMMQMSEENMGSMMSSNMNMWREIVAGKDGELINDVAKKQYELAYGRWPESYDEIILFLDKNNELDDLTLYALGLKSEEEVNAVMEAAFKQKEVTYKSKKWSYEEVCGTEYVCILNSDCYKYDDKTNTYTDLRDTETGLSYLYNNGLKLKVVGIARPDKDAVNSNENGSIGYTYKLTQYIINNTKNADVVKAQLENQNVDVFTGLPFKGSSEGIEREEKAQLFRDYISQLNESGKAKAYKTVMSIPTDEQVAAYASETMAGMSRKDIEDAMLSGIGSSVGVDPEEIRGYLSKLGDDELKKMFEQMLMEQYKSGYAAEIEKQFATMTQQQLAAAMDEAMKTYTDAQCAQYYDSVLEFSSNTYKGNLKTLGCVDEDVPSTINLYAASFEDKDVIEEVIESYNDSVDEMQQIQYTDYVGLMMSSITTIINAITYVLISFVAVSLIVSSIMIGVITLISVQERTKEIGILRAIGASKKNVSRMFNAETVIIGFTSGALGVIVTYLFCIPINLILHKVTDINNLSAFLPPVVGVILIVISMMLTLIAGIIPSRSAAKKDPVVALRTE